MSYTISRLCTLLNVHVHNDDMQATEKESGWHIKQCHTHLATVHITVQLCRPGLHMQSTCVILSCYKYHVCKTATSHYCVWDVLSPSMWRFLLLNRGDACRAVLCWSPPAESSSHVPGWEHHRLHQRRDENPKQLSDLQVRSLKSASVWDVMPDTEKMTKICVLSYFKHILILYVVSPKRDCQALVNVRKDLEKQQDTHIHFRGGVNMGIGSFNLVSALESIAVIHKTYFWHILCHIVH